MRDSKNLLHRLLHFGQTANLFVPVRRLVKYALTAAIWKVLFLIIANVLANIVNIKRLLPVFKNMQERVYILYLKVFSLLGQFLQLCVLNLHTEIIGEVELE